MIKKQVHSEAFTAHTVEVESELHDQYNRIVSI